MQTEQIFRRVAELRRELADVAETLTDEQLATPSLCGTWDVRTVIAHLTVLPTISKPRFGLAALRHRGDIDRTIDAISRQQARLPISRVAGLLRDNAESRATPPLMPAQAPLADLIAHTADYRIPLGLPFTPVAGDAELTLGFLSRSPLGFQPRRRLDGIRLVAVDLGQSWGEGAEVTGTAADLITSVLGRPVALDRLDGPGRDLLLSRI